MHEARREGILGSEAISQRIAGLYQRNSRWRGSRCFRSRGGLSVQVANAPD